MWVGDDLALAGLAAASAPGPLGYLGPLVLGDLVEDAVGELALRRIVAPVVEGADLRPVLLELAPEEVVIGGLAGEAVPVLCQHHRDAPSGHEVPHAVHAGPLEARAALAGV